MSKLLEVRIPDIGSDEKVDVVEVLVAEGDQVEVDTGLVTLESDKASMDVPSPAAGRVVEISAKVGDRIGEGDLILKLHVDNAGEQEEIAEPGAIGAPAAEESATKGPAPIGATTDADASFDSELVVIGGGPGGYTAAFRAADLGLKVTLIERYPTLGGVCLNVGCIPSKALLHVARVLDEARLVKESGVEFGKPTIDLERLRAWKASIVERLTAGLGKMAAQRGVEVIPGSAHFTGAHSLELATAERTQGLSFDQAIVAVGSRVIEIPGIPVDDPRVMDSTDALELPEIPQRLLVIGGGIIGLEMAMVYGALGSKLVVVELLDGLIPGCDRDLVRPLERRLKRDLGAEIYLETRVANLELSKKGLVAHLEGAKAPKTLDVDRVLVAVGRRPNADLLNVDAAGLAVDKKGFLAVDRQMRTNVSHIFAIGDITGQPMLAHKATHEGKVAAEVAAGGKSSFDARVIPSVAYTDPEIAWVGLTETDAKATGTVYQAASFPWAASGRALGMGRSEGKTKLLFDPETKRVLGGGIVGPGAGDLIAEIGLAIEMDCEAADLALTIHPHPTLSETIGFAAEVFDGTITDLYLAKKRS
ncbi:MAG: dihydrolipoyl dehydrogenase [Acidobacteriota bacterium]|nr:dihydrolipoyl dehydrogenase [Acidobacteriota bacterium]